MITHWDILMEFGFYSMAPKIGMLLNGELAPSSRPWPFFDGWVLFFLPLPRICFHVPIKGGGGWYIPNRGAPWPSCFPVFLPNLGDPLPVIY